MCDTKRYSIRDDGKESQSRKIGSAGDDPAIPEYDIKGLTSFLPFRTNVFRIHLRGDQPVRHFPGYLDGN